MSIERYPGADELLVNDFVKEYAERLFKVCPLYTVHDSTVIDSLYQESVHKVYKLVGKFLMYADTKNEIDTLTKFGIDRKRDIVFYLPRVVAMSVFYKGVPYAPCLQDLVDFNGIKYVISHIEETTWWAQSDRSLYYAMFADKFQETDRYTITS